MSENEIKPVAWTIDEQMERVRAGEIGFIAPREKVTPAADVPLYDQSAIDHLMADRDSWEGQAFDRLEEWDEMQVRCEKAEAERDAAVADAERYRWLRKHLVNWCPDGDTARLSWQSREVLDAEIDAARSEGE